MEKDTNSFIAQSSGKKKPHTEFEKHLLVELIQPHLDVLENKKTDGTTLRKKQLVWENLAREFNNSPNVTNTVHTMQIKKMWQNLKTRAREAKTLENLNKQTGGGPKPQEMGPLEARIIATIPNFLPTINVDMDSDTIYDLNNNEDGDTDDQGWLPKRRRETTSTVTLPDPIIINTSAGASSLKTETIDDIKKKIYEKELEHCIVRFDLEIKHMKEKHEKEMKKIDLELIQMKEKHDRQTMLMQKHTN